MENFSRAISRRDETRFIEESLVAHRPVERIVEPGTLDGGDVLVVNHHCIVGLSERTNLQGATQLGELLSPFGYKNDIVEVDEALHFKSNGNFIDDQTLRVTQSCYELNCLADYKKLVVPQDETYVANVVWINGTLLIPEGYPVTQRLLNENGYQTIIMPVSEISKMDSGLTCLSLRLV